MHTVVREGRERRRERLLVRDRPGALIHPRTRPAGGELAGTGEALLVRTRRAAPLQGPAGR
eukprot:358519-Chlamydomonas_euryale.AAC.4